MTFSKRYKEFAARARVPLGFLLLIVYAVFARPTWDRAAVGLGLALVGLALRAWATGHLDKNRDLCMSGPYAHTRNPLYLGTATTAAGFAIAGGEWWIAVLFALVLGFIYWPVVIEEESHLRNIFPGFAAYAERVPRFWPVFWADTLAAQASPAPFRWSLYRQNQEYNAAIGFTAGTVLLLWKLLMPVAHAQAPFAAPFAAGESTDYDIAWRVFGAGAARMTLNEEIASGKPVWRATVEAHSTGIVSRLYKVEDVYRSLFQSGTYCSEQLEKTIQEGNRHHEMKIDFDSARRVAAVRETDVSNNRVIRQQDNPMPPCTFDVLSGLFYVRTLKLEVGKPLQVPINDGSRTIFVDVDVQAKEEIKTPAGVFQTIRIEPQVFGGALFKKSGRLQVWLTDDDKHRLVQLRARLFFGNITATATK